jgi:hypothetical protein
MAAVDIASHEFTVENPATGYGPLGLIGVIGPWNFPLTNSPAGPGVCGQSATWEGTAGSSRTTTSMAVEPLDPAELPVLAGAFRRSQLVYAAAALGLADHLRDDARTAGELATIVGAHERSLARLLRALASEGVLAYEAAQDRFGLTAFSERLLSDAPDSLRAMVLGWSCLPAKYDAWGGLLENVRTGRSAFRIRHGVRFYDHLAAHPEEAIDYDRAMSSTVEGFAAAADGYDYSTIGTLVDVGGGQGLLLAAVLRRYPSMRGVLFDLPAVVAHADGVLTGAGVADRVEIVGGDMFRAIPAGGDGYIFSTVFRCFDDDECLTVLRRCRDVVPDHGRLLAIEMVQPDGPWQSPAGLGDLDAMVLYGGADRTGQEWTALLDQTGFRLLEIAPLDAPYHLVVGCPVAR